MLDPPDTPDPPQGTGPPEGTGSLWNQDPRCLVRNRSTRLIESYQGPYM
jgi:hypothetical protein